MFIIIYGILASVLFWVVRDDWRKTLVSTDTVNQETLLPELTEGQEISQEFSPAADRMHSLTLRANKTPGASESGQNQGHF